MKHRLLRIFILVLATAYAVSSQPLPMAGSGPLPLPLSDKQTPEEKQIEARDRANNGIQVGEPKVYDNALLQRMLEETENRLAQVKLIDGGEIAKRLGAVTGAEQTISSFALSAQGSSVPGADTKTTATAPAPTTSLPASSTFSVSSSDILNEQMQLSFEVANLRLLLAGSLSDHFTRGGGLSADGVKVKTTLGFPITISPDKRYKEAVAIVEIEVENPGKGGADELPAVTALLPREKTYNVASITDKSTAIQGGMVTQVVGVSGSWLRGRKTYYLVQDQDTVALSYQPQESNRIGFMWQFRPVLGRDFVKSGQKQNFVQIAFPPKSPLELEEEEESEEEPRKNQRDISKDYKGRIGRVFIRTYWRKYDRKRGVVKEIIPNSLKEVSRPFNIPEFPSLPAYSFNKLGLEDLGNGQMLVRVNGRFLPGTFVRIGRTVPAFDMDYKGIRFAASADDLATKNVVLVAHDGTEASLIIEHMDLTPVQPRARPKIVTPVEVTTLDDANSLVKVTLENGVHILHDAPPLVMVIGGRVFGYSDAPIERDEEKRTLSAVVPTALLIANPEVIVKPLFAPVRSNPPYNLYEDRAKLKVFSFESSGEKLTLLEQKDKEVTFLLRGSRLSDLNVVVPHDVTPGYIGRDADKYTMRTVTLTAAHLAAHKHLVLRRGQERPFMIAIPSLEKKTPKPIQATERVVMNADEVVLEGDGVGDIESAKYKDRKIQVVHGKDGSVMLAGLRLQGVTEVAMTRTIDLKFKDGKPGSVKLDIVTSKVEQVNK